MQAVRQIGKTGREAFTLIEMLIVIVILGILAMVIIPQISTSTDDAKLSTLQTNLNSMRNAVELYYAQHNSSYPGAKLGGASTATDAFAQQLTRYTDVDGNIANIKDATFKYGPYIKGGSLPMNPFNERATVVVDATENDITVKASDGTTGWKFYALTGVLMANDGNHDTE
jgi:prepilin-type N-terminal cleavage/methylation domain-containing protein